MNKSQGLKVKKIYKSTQFRNREDFLELTSDSMIRKAAYPEDEYVSNGGKINGLFILNDPIALQDVPPEITTISSLLTLGDAIQSTKQNPKKRTENINNHWKKIQSHDYYKYLMSDVNFRKAWVKFQKMKNKKNKGSLVLETKPIDSEFADFRFFRLVAFHIGFQLFADSVDYKPTYAGSKTLKKASGYITKLLGTFSEGVSIIDFSHHSQLEAHLKQLLNEIECAPPKEKETQNSEKRKCLESFALNFKLNFGFISATILTDLLAMLGWVPEHTTIDRVVVEAKSKYKQRLAKALLEHTAQNS